MPRTPWVSKLLCDYGGLMLRAPSILIVFIDFGIVLLDFGIVSNHFGIVLHTRRDPPLKNSCLVLIFPAGHIQEFLSCLGFQISLSYEAACFAPLP